VVQPCGCALPLTVVRQFLEEHTVKTAKDEDDGGFTAWIEELPGCVSDGATEPEALDNLAEAFRGVTDETRSVMQQRQPSAAAAARFRDGEMNVPKRDRSSVVPEG